MLHSAVILPWTTVPSSPYTPTVHVHSCFLTFFLSFFDVLADYDRVGMYRQLLIYHSLTYPNSKIFGADFMQHLWFTRLKLQKLRFFARQCTDLKVVSIFISNNNVLKNQLKKILNNKIIPFTDVIYLIYCETDT